MLSGKLTSSSARISALGEHTVGGKELVRRHRAGHVTDTQEVTFPAR